MTTAAATASPSTRGSAAARRWRRESVLDAAREAFVVHGYHGVSMEQVGVRAGISKPVLYSHFSGKLDLYLAVLQQYLDAMVAGLREALAVADDRAAVRGAIAVFFDIVDGDGTGAQDLVFSSAVPSEPCIEWRVKQSMAVCATLIGKRLCADRAEPARARMVAFGVVGAARLASRQWRDAGRPIPKADAVDTATALCWTGLSGVDRVAGDAGTCVA